MGIAVYADPCTINCRKVISGLDLMKAPYDLKFVDYFKGEQKSEENVKINGMATVPFATDGDLVITESNAILQYAADVNKADKYYPTDLKQRASVNKWLLWEAASWFGSCYIYTVENVVKPLLGSDADPAVLEKERCYTLYCFPMRVDSGRPNFEKLAGILNTQLGKTDYLAGDHVTIADIAVAACMHLWEDAKLPLDQFSNLTRWYAAIDKLPEWSRAQDAVDKNLVPKKWAAKQGKK